MKKKYKIGIIGAGFMSSSIIKGIIKSKIIKNKNVIVSDISLDALNKIKQTGVNTTQDNKFLCDNSEYVLFAIKPQNLNAVLEEIKDTSCNNFISIMAGVKKGKISAVIKGAKIARCMPNTPCSIGCGAVAIDLKDYTLDSEKAFIKSIFTSFAKVEEVDEELLNAVTGISGSSPAYFYLFVKGIIDAGVKNGLSFETAKNLVVSTMKGSAEMIFNNKDKSIEELINAVCSKGGTTIEAMNSFENDNLLKITEKAVESCIKRSKELESL
ncbi:MAG: pyrroline-5-carboxylate reductase [Clostridia bacterium]|nr:pyrroline-5-carboxylate reductase [Clostridia bacterium]